MGKNMWRVFYKQGLCTTTRFSGIATGLGGGAPSILKTTKHIYVYIIIAIAITSCGKSNLEVSIPKQTTPINDTMQGVVFTEGSWWVFKRTKDNVADTLTVVYTKHDTARYIDRGIGYNYEYYKTVYRISSNKKEYACYYYLNRAKFECTEPFLAQTGQDFFYPNLGMGLGSERDAHCCKVENVMWSITINGKQYSNAVYFRIEPSCQWNKELFPVGAAYWFNREVGFLSISLYGSLGWGADVYKLDSYHVNHL